MHPTSSIVVHGIVDAATVAVSSSIAFVGLVCVYQAMVFQLWIHRRGLRQLSFFNGPWAVRISLILVAIFSGVGEIARSSSTNGRGVIPDRRVSQENICLFYIVSNLGFTEPANFLTMAALLHAGLQRREAGTLTRRWNSRTLFWVVSLCFPAFAWQVAVVFVGPRFNRHGNTRRLMAAKLFSYSHATHAGIVTCTYPLLSTAFLGGFYVLLIIYVVFVGSRMLSSVINKGLRRRIYVLLFAVIVLLPARTLLLGFSIMPKPGGLLYESLVFLAFLALALCAIAGIVVLVYFPIADTLALRDEENDSGGEDDGWLTSHDAGGDNRSRHLPEQRL